MTTPEPNNPVIKEHLQQLEDAINNPTPPKVAPAKVVAPPPKVNPVVDATPNTLPVVPADWAAFGAETGYNPKLADDLNLYIVGPYNEGKTTFDSSIPSNIILDFEGGANAVVGTNSIRIHIQNFPHFLKVHEKLMEDAKNNKRHWIRVSFDSVEEYIDMIKHQIEDEKNLDDVTEFGSQGHGFNLILQRAWSYVMDLKQSGYVWAMVGHQKVKTETNPVTKKEESKLREAVFPSVASKIKNTADFQLTIYYIPKTVKEQHKKKISGGREITLETEKTVKVYYADCLTTNRGAGKSRGVPDMDTKFEIPLVNGWNVFKERYDAAVEVAKKKYQ